MKNENIIKNTYDLNKTSQQSDHTNQQAIYHQNLKLFNTAVLKRKHNNQVDYLMNNSKMTDFFTERKIRRTAASIELDSKQDNCLKVNQNDEEAAPLN